MKVKRAEHEQLANFLILKSAEESSDIGLMTGQMGILIVIALYAQKFDKPILERVSDCLFENVRNCACHMSDCSFAQGLSGVAWGVEFLSQEGIFASSGNEICGVLDQRIMERNIRRTNDFSLETGLLGLWHYFTARVIGNIRSGIELPFDNSYIADWKTIISNYSDRFPAYSNVWINHIYNNNGNQPKLNLAQFISPYLGETTSNLSLWNGVSGLLYKRHIKT